MLASRPRRVLPPMRCAPRKIPEPAAEPKPWRTSFHSLSRGSRQVLEALQLFRLDAHAVRGRFQIGSVGQVLTVARTYQSMDADIGCAIGIRSKSAVIAFCRFHLAIYIVQQLCSPRAPCLSYNHGFFTIDPHIYSPPQIPLFQTTLCYPSLRIARGA